MVRTRFEGDEKIVYKMPKNIFANSSRGSREKIRVFDIWYIRRMKNFSSPFY